MSSRFIAAARKASSFAMANLHPGKSSLAYVGGWLGHLNLGDEALRDAAHVLFPGRRLWHYDGSRLLGKMHARLPGRRHGIIAGGTIINRCQEYLDIAGSFLCGKHGLHVFGTGVSDPLFWEGRKDYVSTLEGWRTLLSRCDYIGVRGPRSAEILRQAGVERVEVVGDPVLVFASAPNPSPQPRTIGLNIGYNHGNQWGTDKELFEAFTKLATQARLAGWNVHWFVVFPKDLPITKSIAESSGTSANIHTCYSDAREYIRRVGGMRVFAGMKLHATALAACAIVPSLMVEYEPKCRDFMDSIQQGEFVVRSDRFDADAAWQRLLEMDQNHPSHVRLLHSHVQALKQFQAQQADALCRIMAP